MGWWSALKKNVGELGSDIGGAFKSAGSAVGGAFSAAGNGIVDAGKWVGRTAESGWNAATDFEAMGEGISNAWDSTKGFAVLVVEDPGAAWDKTKGAAIDAGKFYIRQQELIAQGVVNGVVSTVGMVGDVAVIGYNAAGSLITYQASMPGRIAGMFYEDEGDMPGWLLVNKKMKHEWVKAGCADYLVDKVRFARPPENNWERTLMYGPQAVVEIGAFVAVSAATAGVGGAALGAARVGAATTKMASASSKLALAATRGGTAGAKLTAEATKLSAQATKLTAQVNSNINYIARAGRVLERANGGAKVGHSAGRLAKLQSEFALSPSRYKRMQAASERLGNQFFSKTADGLNRATLNMGDTAASAAGQGLRWSGKTTRVMNPFESRWAARIEVAAATGSFGMNASKDAGEQRSANEIGINATGAYYAEQGRLARERITAANERYEEIRAQLAAKGYNLDSLTSTSLPSSAHSLDFSRGNGSSGSNNSAIAQDFRNGHDPYKPDFSRSQKLAGNMKLSYNEATGAYSMTPMSPDHQHAHYTIDAA